MRHSPRLLPLALLLLAACSSGGEDTPDAGTSTVEDLCNSRDEALSMAECELKPGQPLERFLALTGDVKGGDRDWYSIPIPADADARTLVHLTGTYLASSTAVNLSLNVLEVGADGKDVTLVVKQDLHGQGQPQPVDIILPYSKPNTKLLLVVEDAPANPSKPNFDVRSPYKLTVEVLKDPDANEPNDTKPTAIPLAAQGTVQVGTARGYLSTNGDVDLYSFPLTAGKVAYVRLTAPDQGFVPNYRLSYELRRPDTGNTKEVEGQVLPKVRPGVLATARKVKLAGTWTLAVKGYKAPSDTQTPQGDLRQPYDVEVRVLDEDDVQDRNGDNDALERATAKSLEGTTPGTSGAVQTFKGRIGYTPDPDWYSVLVPALADKPTVLRYRLVSLGSGGRFDPLPLPLGDIPDRQVRAFSKVTVGATLPEQRAACASDATACPKGYGESPGAQALVEGYCNAAGAALCLQSSREEAEVARFPGLSNFQGAIPVPPHGSPVTYYFLVQDDGTNWADDRDYQLEVSWDAEDSEEELAYGGGMVEQPRPSRQLLDVGSGSLPGGVSGFSVSGELSYGYGRLRGNDRATGLGVRGPADYDAVPSDVDIFQYDIPAQSAPEDRAWLVQWEVQNLPDGGTPHGLALDVEFCDGDATDGGFCTPVTTTSTGGALTLAYRADAMRAWHTPSNAPLSTYQPLYKLDRTAASTVVTVSPYACSCLERRFIRGGSLKLAVSATERTDYGHVGYTLRTGYGNYPRSYFSADGGNEYLCPTPVQDGGTALPDGGAGSNWVGGCQFTRQ